MKFLSYRADYPQPGWTLLIQNLWHRFAGRPNRKVLMIMALALVINATLLYLYYQPTAKKLVGDEGYYLKLAIGLARREQVTHNLLWPPLYADWIGLIFTLLGIKRPYIQALQIVLWLISGLLLYKIVQQLLRPIAYYGLSLYLLSPELMAFSHYFWPETLHLFFWFAGLWLLICQPKRALAFAGAGVAFGLAMLTKLLLLPFLPLLFVYAWVNQPGRVQVHTRSIKVLVMVSALLIIILPVMASNWQKQGVFTIADSSIFNLWVGLNDRALVDYREEIGSQLDTFQQTGADLQHRNAIYQTKIIHKIKEQGVLYTFIQQLSKQYFRLFDYQTFFTTQLADGARAAYQFTAPGWLAILKTYSLLTYSFILITGSMGMGFVRIKSTGWVHAFLLFIMYNLILFLCLHVKTRYTIQLLPVFIFFSGVGVYAAHSYFIHQTYPQVPGFVFTKSRFGLSMLLGLLMLGLMFRSLYT